MECGSWRHERGDHVTVRGRAWLAIERVPFRGPLTIRDVRHERLLRHRGAGSILAAGRAPLLRRRADLEAGGPSLSKSLPHDGGFSTIPAFI